MRLPKSLLTALSLLFITPVLYAQNLNKPGYYISLKGDTVSGTFINYPEYDNSPANVVFQPSGSSQPITLSPGQCRGFSVTNSDTYISYHGKRLANATDYKEEQGKSKDEYEDVSIFLRELFNNGHYQLYELKDKKRSNFYISADTIPLKELYYKEYTENGEVVESHVFRDQLFLAFTNHADDNVSLQKKLQPVRYNGKSLARFFTLMTTGKAHNTREKYPARFFVGIGASVNMFFIKDYSNGYGYAPYNTLPGTYKTQVAPVVEAGVKLYHQRNYGRLFFMFRLSAYHYENSQDSTGNSNTANTFKATVLTLPFSVGYKLINTTNASLSFSVGASGLYLLNNMRTTVKGTANPSYSSTYLLTLNYNAFGEVEAAWKKRTSLFGGYYFPCLVGSYIDYVPRHSSAKFGLRYHFSL